ncbi:MAG: hypothetical protein IH621_12130 [Krumholzibacteria bacterium]|nr:hypothetical protein [Candidatus Krumholzibacteria bacterium]
MKTRRYLFVLLFLTFLILTGAAPADNPAPADKVAVTDGHVVHDVGLIWHHVSNWGLIGSAPSAPTTYSDSPSADWPIHSGHNYLWAAGIWVGGSVLGETRVTTGGFSSEFLPTPAPEDTIHATAMGAPGGNRYPWPDADDDADGPEDEEILNGRDDDGDTLVDEDFAAYGDQHFVCTYNDLEPALVEVRPDHTPLHIEVVQQSIQWSSPLAEDFIGYDFTITNVGLIAIEDVYLGMFSDFDIGFRANPGAAEDDYAGFVSTVVQAANGTMVPVQVAYMYDGDSRFPLDGYVGWVLCGHTTDPAGVSAPAEPVVTSFQHFSGNAAFEQGGDPTNDAERYQLLSAGPGDWDSDVLPGRQSDYRVLTASGPFTSLAPGQSLRYQVALVLGAGLDGMIANAAEAVAAYRGIAYDRDGDPSNGAEYVAHWLLQEDVPVAAWTGRIMAEVVDGGAELLLETNLPAEAELAVVRAAGPGVSARRWRRDQLQPAGTNGSHSFYRLRDTDPVGWPREYRLAGAAAGGTLELDRVDLDLMRPSALQLRAGPNPFNPQVTISYAVPRDGRVLLQVFDLRGQLVRTLLDGHHDGGNDAVVWLGDDDAGRKVSSGVYRVRLTDATGLEETRITLLK